MTDYEKELLSLLKKSFSKGEHHYVFDIPESPAEAEKLLHALQTLNDACHILILESPEDGYDHILVEKGPPCCKPLSK